MRYYFAGAYQRRQELAGRAAELKAAGIGAAVTSRWLLPDPVGTDLTTTDAGLSAGMLLTREQVDAAWEFGERDLEDLESADAIVSFTGSGARGGRHIEHGAAIQRHDNHSVGSGVPWMRRLIIIGPREHVFHCHPATEQYDTWDAFLRHEIRNHREGTTR